MRLINCLVFPHDPRRRARRGDEAEPDLHLVQPGGVRGRVVNVNARVARQPGFDLGVLVGGIVVGDQVQFEFGGHAGFDLSDKGEELLVALTRTASRQNLPGGGVQRGEQRRGAVATVVVGNPLDITETERQQGLGALQRLDLRLLVDTQHHGMVGRIQIQPDGIADFLHEERVGR